MTDDTNNLANATMRFEAVCFAAALWGILSRQMNVFVIFGMAGLSAYVMRHWRIKYKRTVQIMLRRFVPQTLTNNMTDPVGHSDKDREEDAGTGGDNGHVGGGDQGASGDRVDHDIDTIAFRTTGRAPTLHISNAARRAQMDLQKPNHGVPSLNPRRRV